MAQAVNIWDVAGTSPAGYVGGNPQFGDMARTSDGNLWMFTGTDNRNPAHWQIIGSQSTDGSGLEQGVDIKDEGVVKAVNIKSINFVGADVTATATGGTSSEATVTVGGGGATSTTNVNFDLAPDGSTIYSTTPGLTITDLGNAVTPINPLGLPQYKITIPTEKRIKLATIKTFLNETQAFSSIGSDDSVNPFCQSTTIVVNNGYNNNNQNSINAVASYTPQINNN